MLVVADMTLLQVHEASVLQDGLVHPEPEPSIVAGLVSAIALLETLQLGRGCEAGKGDRQLDDLSRRRSQRTWCRTCIWLNVCLS